MSENWFALFDKALPTITFVAGLIGSWITDYLRDNRSYKTSRKREWVKFQTDTHLALQEALQDLGRAAGKVLQYEESLAQKDRPIYTESGEELRSCVAALRVLEQRVDNSVVRLSVQHARERTASFGMTRGYTSDTETAFAQALEKIAAAQAAVGKNLRGLMSP